MTAPTTRETADHAELARLAEIAMRGPLSGTRGAETAYRAAANPATVLALLSEIAALREALAAAQNADAENDAHLRSRATQAECQRDELREALVQADLTIRSMPGTDQSDVEFIRQALANQGAE